MKTRAIILMLTFFAGNQTIFSQETKNQTRLFFSASLGPAFGSAKNDMEEGMKVSGLDESMENWLFGGTNKYPDSESNLVHEFELGYYFQGMHGISLDYGMHSHFEVAGYRNTGSGIGNFVRLNSRTRFAALNYYISLKNNYHSFFAGPVLLFRIVKNDDRFNISEPTHQTVPGFNIGYSGKILNKKWWFIAFRMIYRWAPDQKTGPFSTSIQIIAEEPETHTSTYSETNTRMSTFNIFLTAGINMCKVD